MLYYLEKRHEFDSDMMCTHYEVRQYTHISSIGVLMNGKTLKAGTLKQCEAYIRRCLRNEKVQSK